jgi:hypothetical protein
VTTTIGLLHPGEMGAAVGRCLTAAGHRVLWAPEGRSPATAARAAAAGLTAASGGLAGLVRQADVIISVCPPHAAARPGPAGGGAGFGGVYTGRQRDLAGHRARDRRDRGEAAEPATWTAGSSELPRWRPGSSGSTCPARGPVRSERRLRVRPWRPGRRADDRQGRGDGVGGEDGVRVVDQGVGGPAAGGAGAGPGRGRGGRAAGRVGCLPSRAWERSARAAGSAAARAGAGWRRWRRSPRAWPRRGCPRASTGPRPRSTAAPQDAPAPDAILTRCSRRPDSPPCPPPCAGSGRNRSGQQGPRRSER